MGALQSITQHEATRPRNSINKWYINWGLDTSPLKEFTKLVGTTRRIRLPSHTYSCSTTIQKNKETHTIGLSR